MTLAEYLAERSQSDFARQIEVTPGLVYQWLNGLRPVSPKAAMRIEKETGGELRCEVLCPKVQWLRDKRGNVTGYTVDLRKARAA